MTSDTQERKTPAQREADKAFKQVEADKAVSDHAAAQIAFHKNRERLKAERLAREAAVKGSPKGGYERPMEPSTRVRWTREDDERLLSMLAVGRSIADAATHLNRTAGATHQRASQLRSKTTGN